MTRKSPPQASRLTLPAAVLHSPRFPPHPDSEESVQYERHRVSQELSSIGKSGRCSLNSGQCDSAIQTEDILSRSTTTQTGTSHANNLSEIPTASDSQGPNSHNVRSYRLRRQSPRWYGFVVNFWTTHISIELDEGVHRDHLALERTFLGYLRTSAMLCMTGVIITQLFRLQHTANPNLNLGFFVLGVPVAASFIGLAILVLLIGAYRFWSQQRAMIRGTVYAGGWDISLIMLLSIILCLIFFVLTVAIDIDRSY